MKILLLGGTGVIGSSLIERLSKDNVEIYVTSRRQYKSYGCVRYIQGNAKDLSFLQTTCMKCKWDAIVDFMSYNTQEFESRVNLLLSSTRQYVFISSARVYGNEEHPIKETSPRLLDCCKDVDFINSDEYSITKARQEDLLLKSSANNYTIVRPCITYGPERLQLGVLEKEEWLYRALHGRKVVFCQEILNSLTTMTLDSDICLALCALLGNQSAIGECFHLSSPYYLSWAEVISIYKKIFDKLGLKLEIEIVSLKDFLHCRYPYLKYQVIYDRVYDRSYDVSKIGKLVNVERFISPEDGLYKCTQTFIEKKLSFKRINWIYEARKDKLTKERTPFTEIKGLKNKLQYFFERYVKLR